MSTIAEAIERGTNGPIKPAEIRMGIAVTPEHLSAILEEIPEDLQKRPGSAQELARFGLKISPEQAMSILDTA